MSITNIKLFFVGGSVLVLLTQFAAVHSGQRATVDILVERIQRVSPDEVRFWLKVTNRSDRVVFFNGINYESGPRLYPVYLEQSLPKEGWKRSSCADTPPPDVLRLNPGDVRSEELGGKLPISRICKAPITRFEGKFRFRLEYFESEEQARAFVKERFSPRWEEALAPFVVSKTFEIPPVSISEH